MNDLVYHQPDLRRILDRVIITDGCFAYDGPQAYGYPQCKYAGKSHRVHRLLYEYLVGAVPEGSHLHHACQNKGCVNIDHLIPLTRTEHAREHHKTHCPQGHPYDGDNLYVNPQGYRECRACHRKRKREAWRLKNWGTTECA
jgi:HNH endonuclease